MKNKKKSYNYNKIFLNVKINFVITKFKKLINFVKIAKIN